MTDRRKASTRDSRDPYGIGPVAGYVGPIIAVVALVIIAIVTLNLLNGRLPFRPGSSGTGDPGPAVTPAPSNPTARFSSSEPPRDRPPEGIDPRFA